MEKNINSSVLPLVSVIVPCYNLQDYIYECIISLTKQTYKNIEIIVVDDGSSDGSYDISISLQKDRNNLFVYKQTNGGASSARNNGIKNSNGEYILFVDGDDFVGENFVSDLIDHIYMDNVDMVKCGFYSFKNGKKETSASPIKNGVFITNDLFLKNLDYMSYMYLSPVCTLYKSSIIKNNSIQFDTELKVFEDGAFNVDYFKYVNGMSVFSIGEYYYRIREDSLIHTFTDPRQKANLFKHYCGYFDSMSMQQCKTVFTSNPIFIYYFWHLAIIDKYQAVSLDNGKYKSIDYKYIRMALDVLIPQTHIDKLFVLLIKNKSYLFIDFVVRFKIFLLKSSRLYNFFKKIMT